MEESIFLFLLKENNNNNNNFHRFTRSNAKWLNRGLISKINILYFTKIKY